MLNIQMQDMVLLIVTFYLGCYSKKKAEDMSHNHCQLSFQRNTDNMNILLQGAVVQGVVQCSYVY